MNEKECSPSSGISRRGLLRNAVAGLASAVTLGGLSNHAHAQPLGTQATPLKGRIKQSVVSWCFANHWTLEETCRVARELGCKSVELVGPDQWETLRKFGLTCAISPIAVEGPPFIKGFNNPEYHPWLTEVTRKAVDQSADFGCPNVIAFTGFSENFSREEGARNCVEGLKKIAAYAEEKRVTVCLEMLNSRVGDHPDKGHPGYQGDHVDYCMDILHAVGSPRVKLLFDVYHVQIMDGDVIRRIHQCGEMIGHIHTAGNPGRGELGASQELNYPPIMEALLEIGYGGYVGQEFIPTGDPYEGLSQAVQLCDV